VESKVTSSETNPLVKGKDAPPGVEIGGTPEITKETIGPTDLIPLRSAAINLRRSEKWVLENFKVETVEHKRLVSKAEVIANLAKRGLTYIELTSKVVDSEPDPKVFVKAKQAALINGTSERGLPLQLYPSSVMYGKARYFVRDEIELLKERRESFDPTTPGGLGAIFGRTASRIRDYKELGELTEIADGSAVPRYTIESALDLARKRFPKKLELVLKNAVKLKYVENGSELHQKWTKEVEFVKKVLDPHHFYTRDQLLNQIQRYVKSGARALVRSLKGTPLGRTTYFPKNEADALLASLSGKAPKAALKKDSSAPQPTDLVKMILKTGVSVAEFYQKRMPRGEAVRLLGWEPQAVSRYKPFDEIKLGRWHFVLRDKVLKMAKRLGIDPSQKVTEIRDSKANLPGAVPTKVASAKLGRAKGSLPAEMRGQSVKVGRYLQIPGGALRAHQKLSATPNPRRRKDLKKLLQVSDAFLMRRIKSGELDSEQIPGSLRRYKLESVLNVTKNWKPRRLPIVLEAAEKRGEFRKNPELLNFWRTESEKVQAIISEQSHYNIKHAMQLAGVTNKQKKLYGGLGDIPKIKLGGVWYFPKIQVDDIVRRRNLPFPNPLTVEGLASIVGQKAEDLERLVGTPALRIRSRRGPLRTLEPDDVIQLVSMGRPELKSEIRKMVEEHMSPTLKLDYYGDKFIAGMKTEASAKNGRLSQVAAALLNNSPCITKELVMFEMNRLERRLAPLESARALPERAARSKLLLKKMFMQEVYQMAA